MIYYLFTIEITIISSFEVPVIVYHRRIYVIGGTESHWPAYRWPIPILLLCYTRLQWSPPAIGCTQTLVTDERNISLHIDIKTICKTPRKYWSTFITVIVGIHYFRKIWSSDEQYHRAIPVRGHTVHYYYCKTREMYPWYDGPVEIDNKVHTIAIWNPLTCARCSCGTVRCLPPIFIHVISPHTTVLHLCSPFFFFYTTILFARRRLLLKTAVARPLAKHVRNSRPVNATDMQPERQRSIIEVLQ